MNIISFSEIRALFFDHTSVRQTIFKNTFWLAVGSGFNKLLKLILLIYAARILGAEEYGKFSFALAFVSLFVIFHDFGLPLIAIREFSKEEKKEDFYSLISLKAILSLAVLFLISLSLFFITPDFKIRNIIFVLAVFSLINGFITLFYTIFQARQRMEYQTWGETFQSVLATCLGLFILFKFPSIDLFSYTYLFASAVSLMFVLVLFQLKVFSIKICFNKTVWKNFLKMSWPLALTSLFSIIYNNIDSVMMGYRGMIQETGWYNAAYRIVFATLIPMGLITGSFYPVLSKFFQHSKEKIQETWNDQVNLTILIVVPLVTGGLFLAPKIIYSFYSESFAPSILAFQILIIMAGLLFLCQPCYDIMIVSGKQNKTFWITLAGCIINIFLNLILIPKYSLYGAASATVITYMVILLVYLRFLSKFTQVTPFRQEFLFIFILAILASAVMYFILRWSAIYRLNVFISVPIGISVYLASLILFKKIKETI